MQTPPPREPNVFLGSYDKPFVTSREDVPFISHNDGPRLQPSNTRDARVSVLDLSKPEDMQMYTMIWQAAGHSCVTVFNMDSRWMEDVKNWKVLIHWHFDSLMMKDEITSTRLSSVKKLMAISADREEKVNTLVEMLENEGKESKS